MRKCPVKMAMVGIQDRFGQSGKPPLLMEEYNITAQDIVSGSEGCAEQLKKRRVFRSMAFVHTFARTLRLSSGNQPVFCRGIRDAFFAYIYRSYVRRRKRHMRKPAFVKNRGTENGGGGGERKPEQADSENCHRRRRHRGAARSPRNGRIRRAASDRLL